MAERLVPDKKAEEICCHLENYIDHPGIEGSLRKWIENKGIDTLSELPTESQSFRGRVFKFYNEEWDHGGYIRQEDIRDFIEKKIEIDLIDSQVETHFGKSRNELNIENWTARATRTIVLEICLLIIERRILS